MASIQLAKGKLKALRRIAAGALAMWVGVATGGCDRAAASSDGRASAEQLYQLCAQCHGAEGTGNRAVGAPQIAGLKSWYVYAQLEKFDTGLRGLHPEDLAGMRMRPMSLALAGAEDMRRVSRYVETLSRKKPEATVAGNIETGRALYAPCVACHGPGALGNEATKAPALAGLNDWYVLRQLRHFKSAVRGALPGDVTGGQMAPMVATLEDDQAMKDVTAYIQTLPFY